jgi:hypothetical protein
MSGRIKRKKRIKKRKSQPAIAKYLFALIFFFILLLVSKQVLDIIKLKNLLVAAEANISRAEKYLANERLSRAGFTFRLAEKTFYEATKVLSGADFEFGSWVPFLGNNVVAVRSFCEAGQKVTRAGHYLIRASQFFLGNQRNFIVRKGTVNLENLSKSRRFLEEALLQLQSAKHLLIQTDSWFLLPSIKEKRESALAKVSVAEEVLKKAIKASRLLPSFLAQNGERRYLLAVQNNAELRATGGIIGNYGIIKAQNGHLSLEVFDEIHSLQLPKRPKVKAPRWFAQKYDRFFSRQLWLNANMSPDFPTVSRVLLELYQLKTGEKLDGVISIDPKGLAYLLRAFKPITLQEYHVQLNADNVVDWTLNRAYQLFPERAARKNFLSDVAYASWQRFLSAERVEERKLLKNLSQAVLEKHLMLYSIYPKEERLINELGAGGRILTSSMDYLQVVLQNIGANKVDYFLRDEVSYHLKLKEDGTAVATVTIKLRNEIPVKGLPPYVTGQGELVAHHGLNRLLVSIYVPDKAELLKVSVSGERPIVDVAREKSKKVFATFVEIKPAKTKQVIYKYRLPAQILNWRERGKYYLVWQQQPRLVPSKVRIKISVPTGYLIAVSDSKSKSFTNFFYSESALSSDYKLDLTIR